MHIKLLKNFEVSFLSLCIQVVNLLIISLFKHKFIIWGIQTYITNLSFITGQNDFVYCHKKNNNNVIYFFCSSMMLLISFVQALSYNMGSKQFYLYEMNHNGNCLFCMPDESYIKEEHHAYKHLYQTFIKLTITDFFGHAQSYKNQQPLNA